MKRLIVIIGLFLCVNGYAQLKPFAGVEYFTNNQEILKGWGRRMDYHQGDLAMIYGIGYHIKGFEAKTSATTLMYLDELASYTPTHTEFKISGGYRLKEFSIKVEHMCLHPLETFQKIPVKKFAGYTKVGIYWNME